MSDTNFRTYVDDDCGERGQMRTLVMAVAGSDYYLQTVQAPMRAGPDDPEPGEIVSKEIVGPLVRIRTSGSSDPRNMRVCNALRELWEALGSS